MRPDRRSGKRGPSNPRRRLDGTILGIRRLRNLSVPFRLSPGGRGGPILSGFPSPRRLRRSLSRRYFQRSAERMGVIGGRVDLYLDQQHIDTTTPTGRLLYQITGAFAEFERSMIRSRVNAGLARARAQGSGQGVGETRDGGWSGLIRPKYPTPNRRNRSDAPLPRPLVR